MVVRSFDGVSSGDCWRRPESGGNPLGWLLGHMVVSRAQLLRALGRPYDHRLGHQFDRGSMLVDPSQSPAREILEAAWTETRPLMRDAFAALSDEAVMAAAPGRPRPGVQTVADLIAFSAFHESYHVGQMGYLRRLLGLPGVAG